jgi:hypothetical protein
MEGHAMKLNSSVTVEEVREALQESSLRTWGEQRTSELSGALDKTAKDIATVLQYELAPPSEEPEFPAAWIQPEEKE